MSNNLRKERFNDGFTRNILYLYSVFIVQYWQHIAVLLEVCDFSFTINTSVESIQFNPT